ncbi:histidine kinase [Paucibacter sp. KBW04]|uniref:cache domain-containing protein n=1 Tax=Paucibacter sp. KBW04 TaxID=2153361 RepID=UPI000F56E1CD|nr:cache domain-containing protein [Paucibacter sp. KBW04]RQO57196.1 histidine kinase [Paucibacter sp. KBW04]
MDRRSFLAGSVAAVGLASGLWSGQHCWAGEVAASAETAKRASREEAVAMVKKAIAQFKRDGAEKTYAAIMDAKGPYRDRDLYVWISDLKTGFTVAHGINPRLLGKDLTGIRDADGQAFVLNLQKLARLGKPGWVNYKWPNPTTNVIESKTTYFEPWADLAFCAGVYLPE